MFYINIKSHRILHYIHWFITMYCVPGGGDKAPKVAAVPW